MVLQLEKEGKHQQENDVDAEGYHLQGRGSPGWQGTGVDGEDREGPEARFLVSSRRLSERE